MKCKIAKIYVAALTVMFAASLNCAAQEFRCNVEVNSQQIEGTNRNAFERLKESLNSYMNETKFSDATFSPIEKIECNLFLTVNEYAGDRIKGDLQLQLIRPVYNSTYTTTLFNFRDAKVEFEYREGDPIVYNEQQPESNLTAILDFYANLFLGIDFDSFSPKGGERFYEKAASIVQQQQSSGEVGWKTFEDNKNRSAVLSSYTDGNTSGIRQLLYDYHRRGLDEMVTSPDKGRETITRSLDEIKNIYSNAPMSVALSIFRDSKLDELVNIYSQAPETERTKVYDLLQPIYPTESERLNKIKNPEPVR
ncbi:MAG: DUF4835 family protein [Candidatus Amulumruptor caecigallinarius]|nr:DUF4835 family protein [Candidatus Amulumruptor caecigallinarius]